MEHENEMIQKIISYVPNEKIRFDKNKFGDTLIIFEKRNSAMCILTSNTWVEIKRIVDMKISKLSDECELCCKDDLIDVKRINCHRCANSWCIGCYTKIFVVNKGLIVCPYCRFSFGEITQDENLLQIGVDEIICEFSERIKKRIRKYIE